jgi:predicted  nucleic acid-binding Zn-ribbon protein
MILPLLLDPFAYKNLHIGLASMEIEVQKDFSPAQMTEAEYARLAREAQKANQRAQEIEKALAEYPEEKRAALALWLALHS